MNHGRYSLHDSDRIRAIREEASRLREASMPSEDTGRHLYEPSQAGPSNGNGHTVVAAITFWKLGAAVLAIVVGTVAASGWIESRIKDRVAPVERRLERIEEKLDKVVEALVKR